MNRYLQAEMITTQGIVLFQRRVDVAPGQAVTLCTVEPDAEAIARDADLEGRHADAEEIRSHYAVEPYPVVTTSRDRAIGTVLAVEGDTVTVLTMPDMSTWPDTLAK